MARLTKEGARPVGGLQTNCTCIADNRTPFAASGGQHVQACSFLHASIGIRQRFAGSLSGRRKSFLRVIFLTSQLGMNPTSAAARSTSDSTLPINSPLAPAGTAI